MCSKRTTDEGGVFVYSGAKNAVYELLQSASDDSTFDTEVVITEAFKRIKLATETKLDRFLGLITRPTIVVLNNNGWSSQELEVLKSLNTFIEEKKRDFSYVFKI